MYIIHRCKKFHTHIKMVWSVDERKQSVKSVGTKLLIQTEHVQTTSTFCTD